MIKHVIAIALVSSPVLAQEKVNAQIEDYYYTVYDRVPETKRICETVQVPVYGVERRQTNGADVLGGMIIGGILGKGLTGKDNGAAAGAVIGGIAAAETNKTKSVVTGYRQEQQCHNEETYRNVERRQYDYSVLQFTLDGTKYELLFNKEGM